MSVAGSDDSFGLNAFSPDSGRFALTNLTTDDPDLAQHWLAGSYYSVRDGLTATLMLNNKGITPVTVQPTLYSKNGRQLELQPVVVGASSFSFIDLNDWIKLGGDDFKEGNVRLYHTGKDLILGAQIYLTDEERSFSFEEKLAELGKFDSRRLEGVLPVPSRQSDVKLVLTNTSGNELTVTGRLTEEPQREQAPQSIVLAAHETKVIDLREILNRGFGSNGKAVAISLAHQGAKWALLARAFVSEDATGYSNLAQFYNPAAGLTNEYHGAGIQMTSPAGEKLKQVIILRNTGSTPSVVTGQMPYTRADGSTGTIALPTTHLAPNQIKTLKTTAIEQRNNRENIKHASIEIKYSGAPGSVAVAVHSQSRNRNFVSRVPLWDPLRQRTATGGYPWLVEGTSVTKNYIKNITDRAQKYVAFFIWENGGMYMIGQKELAPHQSVEIDVKDLRDRQLPDENGNTIPQHISRGQFQWTLRPEENVGADEDPLSELALIGRSEQIDWGRQISNNYACQNCCIGNTTGSHLDPESATVEVGQTVNIRAYIEEDTCFGFSYSYQVGASWISNNANVATVSGGAVTGVNLGNTTVRATFQGPRYISNPPCPPDDGPYLVGCADDDQAMKESSAQFNKNEELNDQLAPGCGQCFRFGSYNASETAAITVVGTPQIDEISPAAAVSGSSVSVQFAGRNFGQSPQINISGNGVTAQVTAVTQNGLEATFQVAANADLGDHNVTVTANGRTSNAVVFRVGDRSPVITSISPDGTYIGENVPVTIEGLDFGLNPTVAIDGLGVSFTRTSASDTQIQGYITVSEDTYAGVRGVKVVSLGRTGLGFQRIPTNSDTSNIVNFNVFSITVTLNTSTNTVWPAETSGTSNVQVSVCLQPALSNKNVSVNAVKRSQYIDNGGHVESQHSGRRPLGRMSSTTGQTGGDGCFRTTYTPSYIAGHVGIDASSVGVSVGLDVLVGIPNLEFLPAGDNYVRIGETASHPKNNWATPRAKQGLINIANDYKNQYYGTGQIPENRKLHYNDTSLPYGGKFDLARTWASTGSHAEHREGINTDVRCCVDPGDVPRDRWEQLNRIFFNNGSTNTHDETQTPTPHWHLRFEFGSVADTKSESVLLSGIENDPSRVVEVNEVRKTPHDFVENVYWAILGREADQKDYEEWLNRITIAKSKGSERLLAESEILLNNLFSSDEYLARQRSNEDFIKDAFWAHLFRDPSQRELEFWANHLNESAFSKSTDENEIRLAFLKDFRSAIRSQAVVLNLTDPKIASNGAGMQSVTGSTKVLKQSKERR